MNFCILYSGVEDDDQVWPDKRSLALQRMAGSNVLGHVLNQLWDAYPTQILVVVERDQEAITAWLEEFIPHVDAKVITAPSGSKPLEAIALCRDYCDKEPLLVTLGNHVTEADYKHLQQSSADVTIFTKQYDEGAWAGVSYFQRGTDFFAALDEARFEGHVDFKVFLENLQRFDFRLAKQGTTMCLQIRTAGELLFANARLLGLGYGTENAIERSYIEDFTVLPPVFLHESAVIENAVVGPFVNVEAGAVIRDSVVRNSLIGKESIIMDVVLDGSIIGTCAQVKGSGRKLLVEDNTEISLADDC